MTRWPHELKNSNPRAGKSRRGIDPVFVLLLTLCCLLPAACGKKADPVCPAGKRPAVVTDITAARDTGGVLLRWSTPPGASGRETYRVCRSVLSREAACPGCPRNFAPFRVAERRDSAVFPEDGTAVLLDGDVTAGSFYAYRVVHCEDPGLCSEP
ncbi:MAG TPA: hypothetical protein PKL99_01330, partial [Syntrophales bacterium]|nr:hypothetical protein [Syntrophales bacterium]